MEIQCLLQILQSVLELRGVRQLLGRVLRIHREGCHLVSPFAFNFNKAQNSHFESSVTGALISATGACAMWCVTLHPLPAFLSLTLVDQSLWKVS